MPAHQKSPLRIFISSPGDVAAERDRAEAVIRKVDADLEHIDLEVVRWEGRPYSAVSTFQTQIDKPSDCDLVVCIFWKRLGTYLPPEFDRPDGSARTGTQYEFEDALEAARSRPDKVPDMFVYRSKAPVTFSEATVAKEQAEKQALEEFWLRWMQNPEGQFLAAFKYYAGADAFAREFERDLRDWLAARDRGGDWSIATSGSPFVGLKAFDEKYASVFFGRRRVTDRLRAALMAAAQLGFPSVFVLGASGIGKSSLCRAGLIPRLMVHGATEPLIDVWRRLVVTPTELGPDLIAGFSRALVVDDVLKEILAGDCRASDQLTALLGSGPSQAVIPVIAALDRFAADVKQKGGFETDPITGLVVVIDQFEELLLAHDDEQRHGFLALLTALAETGRVWLVFTLRTDFYPALQADPPSLALKKRGQVFDVVAPGGAEIRDMIEGPARASGLSYEKSGQRDLAELLEREAAQPGALPMLQYALQALFEAREDEILTLTEYDRLGGAAGALAKKAEDAFSRLDPAAQEAFPRVLGALASFDLAGERVSPAARAANLSQFRPDTPERRLVDMLLGERLLIAFGESGSTESAPPTVRIVHESLFERWPRAADQLATDRQDLDRRTQLERAEKDYQAALAAAGPKAAKDHLLTGIHLTNARDLRQRRPDLLAPTVIAFVDDSYRQARAKQKRLRTLEVSGAALLAGLAAAAFFFASDAEVKRREAQASLETAQQTIGGVLKTLEGPRMERVWGFVDIEGDLMRRLAELQARLPQGKWESQDRAIALTNVRLGLAHERKAEITEAVSKFEEAYTKALPLAQRHDATPEDRELLLRIAYRRHRSLALNGKTAEIDRQVETTLPIAERALDDPLSADEQAKVGWVAHYFDQVHAYYKDKNEYDRASEAINKAIRRGEEAVERRPQSLEARYDLTILYSNRARLLRAVGREDEGSKDDAKSCELAENLYAEAANHRGIVRSWLYCLLDRAQTAADAEDRANAMASLDQAQAIAEDAARYAGIDAAFRAAQGAVVFQRAYVHQNVDRNLNEARNTYGEALAIYSDILAGRRAQLSDFDRVSSTLWNYSGVLTAIEEGLKNEEVRWKSSTAEHAQRLQTVFQQFIDCAEWLGGSSVCGYVCLQAARESGDRLNALGRGAEGVQMLRRTLPLAEQRSADPFYSGSSDWFQQAGAIRIAYGGALTATGRYQEAIDFMRETVAWSKARYDQFDDDFYLGSQWYVAMQKLANAYTAADDTPRARETLKACTEAYGANCYEPYAKMLDDGIGGPRDPAEAKRVRAIKANTNTKRFTVPVSAKGTKLKHDFHLYIFERPPGWKYEGIEDQAIWLERERGLIVPQDVRDSFIKLERIAKENNVSFPDLCVYALGNAAKDQAPRSETAKQAPAAESQPVKPQGMDTDQERPVSGGAITPPRQTRPVETAAAAPALPSAPVESADALYRRGLSRLINGELATAGEFFGEAAKSRHPRATYELAKLNLGLYPGAFSGKADEGLRLMRAAADLGVAPAQVYLGTAAEKNGDVGQAIDWYRKAAAQENIEAKERLRHLTDKR